MAVLAIAALGSAIGSATLGAGILGISGAQIGWLAGSLIGSALAPGVEGPKLADKKVQISSYGAPIPIVYGGVRIAGNVIDAEDLVEHKRKEGGKGGPKVTKYTYSDTFASLICEGEIVSLRRIWADSKIVWDATETADEKALAASAKFAKYFTLYIGTETQLPDPTLEAQDGVGNVPAYRGYAYVVFADLPLEDYGNRIPSFSFEISTEPGTVLTEVTRTPLIVRPWETNSTGRPVHKDGAAMDFQPFTGSSIVSYGGAYSAALSAMNASLFANGGYGYGVKGMSDATNFLGFNSSTNRVISKFPSGATVPSGLTGSQQWVELIHARVIPVSYSTAHTSDYLYYDVADAGGVVNDGNYHYTLTSDLTAAGLQLEPAALPKIIDPYVSSPDYEALNNGFGGTIVGPLMTMMRALRVPDVPPPSCSPGDPCKDGIAELPDDSNFCLTCDGELSFNLTWTKITGTAKQLCNVEYRSQSGVSPYLDTVFYQQALGPVLLPDDPDYDNDVFWADAKAAAIADGTLIDDDTIDSPVVVAAYAQSIPPPVDQVEGGFILLSEIVEDLCVRAGLEASQVDVTELTDIVLGYSVARQASARQAIDPLRQAYFFDPVESGDVIKFVKRGHDPVATIPWNDLGASDNGDAEPVEHERQQETELPATLNFAYSARSADYQTGTQTARRLVTVSDQEVTIESAIVMGDTKALSAANGLLYDLWSSRTSRAIQVLRKWAAIEPTDVIEIETPEATYRVRVVDKTEEAGWIRLECKDDDQAAWKQEEFDTEDPANTEVPTNPGPPTAPPPGTTPPSPPPRFDGPTKIMLLDLPLLQEADVDPGYYVAVSGYTAEWRGGYVFRSDDAGANYVQKIEATQAAVFGYAQNALQPFYGGNCVDEINDLTIRLHGADSLVSVTRDQLLNGANACAIGNGNAFEIIQFQRATMVSEKVFNLTGLLRGRFGTERFISTHVSDDLFVLLDPSKVYRIADSYSLIDSASLHKGVTYGETVEAATAIAFTNTGISSRALQPTHVAAADIGGGLYRVKWVRQGRYGTDWLDFVDVPLDMEAEFFDVVVYRAGIPVNASTAINTQTIDIAALAGDVIEVSQVSDRLGAGIPTSITAI